MWRLIYSSFCFAGEYKVESIRVAEVDAHINDDAGFGKRNLSCKKLSSLTPISRRRSITWPTPT